MNTFTLTLSAQEIAIINDALVQLPYIQVTALIQSINLQIQASLAIAKTVSGDQNE